MSDTRLATLVEEAITLRLTRRQMLTRAVALGLSAVAGSGLVSTISAQATMQTLTTDGRALRSLHAETGEGAVDLVGGTYIIRQRYTRRYLDAYLSATHDYQVVTRPNQSNDTQRWLLTKVGTLYRFRQKINNRQVDAYEFAAQDYQAFTDFPADTDSQRWVTRPVGDGSYTLQQLSTGRYMDGFVSSTNDYRVVTREFQTTFDTQYWLLTLV